MSTTTKPDRLYTYYELRPLIGGLSRTTVWRLERASQFPRSIRVSPGRRAWRESDLQRWIEQRASER